jgi:hypothetical protein
MSKFTANGTRYYYRLRGEDGTYSTSWSNYKSFRFGNIITGTPSLTAPSNGATVNYPNMITFQWGTVPIATASEFHFSRKSDFSDTIICSKPSNNTFSYFPFDPNNVIMNGTFYWRVRGIEYATGSFGPWSATWTVNYAGAPTDVNDKANDLPTVYSLSQNYPNPFNPSTTISYTLPYESSVKINIINMLGQEMVEVDNSIRNAGYHKIEFNSGSLPSGIYFYKIIAKSHDGSKEYQCVKKMLLLK